MKPEKEIDYAVEFVRKVQKDTLSSVISAIENLQRELWRVDSEKAEASRTIVCRLRKVLEEI